MQFTSPRTDVIFEIPDPWWEFADMGEFRPSGPFYIPVGGEECEVVPLVDIEPLQRVVGTGGFRKYKIVPVLFGLQSPEPTLPPIRLRRADPSTPYAFVLQNGFHRYYASIAAGYSAIPAIVD